MRRSLLSSEDFDKLGAWWEAMMAKYRREPMVIEQRDPELVEVFFPAIEGAISYTISGSIPVSARLRVNGIPVRVEPTTTGYKVYVAGEQSEQTT